jgi:hypothetical protein
MSRDAETRGMAWGLLGVAIFGLTLPFTRLAVVDLHPVFVAIGRAVVAALPGRTPARLDAQSAARRARCGAASRSRHSGSSSVSRLPRRSR